MSAFNSSTACPHRQPEHAADDPAPEWGFGGTVLSDYQAVQVADDFGYAANEPTPRGWR